MTVHHDQHLFCIQYRSNADRNGSLRNFVDIVIEETGIGDDRIGCQRLDTGTGRQRRTRLVESDMPVRTDTSQEQVHTTGSFHLCFVSGAFGFQIFCVSIQDVHILRLNVDMAEKVVPHERMIAFRMVFR